MNPNAHQSQAEAAQTISVVVTGSECTGKTTLAHDMAGYYSVECVPEYIRQFVETVGGRPQFADHGPIARGQKALEDEFRSRASGLLIHDTDLLSTVVYCQHFFGRCPDWIQAAATDRRPALYILCDIDVPWTADGLRDRGDRRDELHGLFATALATAGAKWIVVKGDRESRLAQARRGIDGLVA